MFHEGCPTSAGLTSVTAASFRFLDILLTVTAIHEGDLIATVSAGHILKVIKNNDRLSLEIFSISRMHLQVSEAFPVLMTVSFKLGVQLTCFVSLDITP